MSTEVGVLNRHGRSIHSVDEWRDHAGPASAEHWKDGRSAKELAKAWIKGDGIAALVRLLDTQSQTAGSSRRSRKPRSPSTPTRAANATTTF